MNQTTTYTPLESLFLFQLLAKYGLVAEAFPRISDELHQNNFINQQESYDAERLSPEKLEQLACRLVREEQVREAEAEAAEKNGNAAGLSPTSRKRKLPSPPLPSLKELQAQRDKLSQLVDRLYTTYQADIVRRIRKDEEALEKLEREVEELESAGAAGNVVAQQEPNIARTNGAIPAVVPKQPQPARPNAISQSPVPVPVAPAQAQSTGRPGAAAPNPVHQPALARKPSQPSQPSPSPIPSNVRPPGDVRQPSPGVRPGNFSNRPPTVPSSGLQHPQTAPGYGLSSGPGTSRVPTPDGLQRPQVVPKSQSPAPSPSPQLHHPQTPGTYKWETPFNPQHPPYHGQPIQRPPSYPGQPQPGQPQHPHPHVHHNGRQTPQPLAQPGRVSTPGNGQFPQPVLVPPQGPVQNAGQTPPPPRHSHPDGSVQQTPQYRHPSVPISSPAATTAVPASQYSHQQQPFQPTQAGVRHPAPHPVQTPGRVYPGPSPTGHRPALAAPTHPGQVPHIPAPHSVPSTPVSHRPVQQPFTQTHNPGAQSASSARPNQRPPNLVNRPPAAVVPPSRPSSQPQTPVSASVVPHVVRGYGTKWTSTPTPSTPRVELSGYFDSQSPAFERLSPPTTAAELPKSSPEQSGKKDGRKNVPKPDTAVPKVQSRLSRSAQKPSQVKESAEEPEIVRKIKNEEATPKPFEDAGDTTADESVHGKPHGTASRLNKRKRQESPVNRAPPAPPTHILWTRSFHKVSASALEQVTSHRHANMFANPIKPRDAPGYPDLILRPQDLKGIRAAINQGQRAAHALEKTLPDLDPNAMNVWLPISVDLIPPKGIINIAQLERELVHMFANSIMYNQDPDRGVGPSFVKQDSEDDNDEAVGYEVDENGIVRETRNMFVEVEKLLSDLRSEIERNAQPSAVGRTSLSRGVSVAGGDASNVEDDGDQQNGDGEAQSIAKRRRKG